MTRFTHHKLILMVTLCALVLMRLVDLSVLDVADAHHEPEHFMSLQHDIAAEGQLAHNVGEIHTQFHSLLGAYILSQNETYDPLNVTPSKFRVFTGKVPGTAQARPPVPPPLA